MACQITTASTALVHVAGKEPPGVSLVRTYAGSVAINVTAVKPSPAVTVVLLLDTLSSTDLENVKKSMLAMQAGLKGRPLRLALVHKGSLGMAGPFPSRSALKSALDEIVASPETETTDLAARGNTLDALIGSVSQLGADWSRVLLIGDLPTLEPGAMEYAGAALARAYCGAHIQASWFSFSGGNDSWLAVMKETGGTIVQGAPGDFLKELNEAGQSTYQLEWRPAEPAAGFVVYRARVLDLNSQVLLEAPDIAVRADGTLPSIESYAAMEAKAAEAAKLLKEAPVTDASAKQIAEDLQTAFSVNPRDAQTLEAAASYYEQLKDYGKAAEQRTYLTEIRPEDADAYAALGHVLVLGSRFETAEAALKRASEISKRTPQMAEDFARIRLAQKDDKGALAYLDECLEADGKRQDLWFLQAGAAERVQDLPLAIRSLERGLRLGGAHVPESASLLRLYQGANQKTKASELAHRVVAGLPAEAGLRIEFASKLDELQMSEEALAAWKSVVEVQPASGLAHMRIARLLLAGGDARGAESSANAGLAAVPSFAELYLVKAEALEKQERTYSARAVLEEGAATAAPPDTTLLARLADAEDTFGGRGAEAYARLAEAYSADSKERLAAEERGFAVAMRDGDGERAQSFAKLLAAAGHPEYQNLLGHEDRSEAGALVPGGLDALAFAAHSKAQTPPDRFFAEYSQTLVDRIPALATPASKLFVEEIEQHFQRIAALQALGKRDKNGVAITLSLQGKEAKRNTEKALDLLGVRLRFTKENVELDRGEKKSQAKKQETLNALAVDEVGIEEALKEGKPYTIEIPYEWAAVYPNEKIWREAFYPKGNEEGGFATALLSMPKLARLYIGISYLDRKVVSELLSATSLKTLYERYADLMYLYSPAFAIEGGRAVVPGGPRAEAIWENLAGASARQPGAFFGKLLERENGKLLAYFFLLSELDPQHQAFFTANLARTTEFYKLFMDSEEGRRGAKEVTAGSGFSEFLRSVPLDSGGHVEFPGSEEVWTVAKGREASGAQMTKLIGKLSKVAAPEVEDELLLRLARTKNREASGTVTELENYLAVARVDAHRVKQLDERAALLLAQGHAEMSNSYAYFTDITELESSDYGQFFAAIARIKTHSVVDANLQLGQLHSLIEWICILRRRQVLNDSDAAKLFRYVAKRFAESDAPATYTESSLDSVRAILGFCKSAEKTDSTDEKLRACIAGGPGQTANRRYTEFQRVMELQKVPSLDALLLILESARKLAAKSEAFSAIKKSVGGLPDVELAKGTKVPDKERENLARYGTGPVQKITEQLGEKVGKKKLNTNEIERVSQELLAELQGQVTLGLAGPVYGYFLRPTDLVVSEDPLLLRKHRYFEFTKENARSFLLPESEFNADSQGAGSYFIGGFAQFALAAGSAAGVGWGAKSSGAGDMIAAQVAAIRVATWERLEESDQRLLSLRIMAGREWIFESARKAEVFQALSEETRGLLSATRRADLLNGIEAKNWRKAWDAVTLSDLLTLGSRYVERFKTDAWTSPVTVALRKVSNENKGSRLDILGAFSYHSLGCGHAHLLEGAPYEEYERRLFATEIAERAAEFKLFLAFQADSLGVVPSALGNVAETLASKAFRNAHMTDGKDWRGVLAGYASIRPADIQQALEQ